MRREDARIALEELRREPAARIFARAHAGSQPDEDGALVASVLMPLLTRVTESCGGFDWRDDAFDRAYAELEDALFRESHGYAAVAPLVGLAASAAVELGPGLRVRHAVTGELASYWPEANGLLPPDFGREPDRLLVVELVRDLPPGAEEAPDAPGEIADAVTAIRLATQGAVAAGPVLFERLDFRPYGIRPVVPIAATVPDGGGTRLDPFRGALARDLLERLTLCDDDPDLGEALDRWELSLFQDDPFRSEQLRESLTALLGGTDGLWAAGLRAALLLRLKEPLEEPDPDSVRRALVEVLVHGDRASLIRWLDDAALGSARARSASSRSWPLPARAAQQWLRSLERHACRVEGDRAAAACRPRVRPLVRRPRPRVGHGSDRARGHVGDDVRGLGAVRRGLDLGDAGTVAAGVVAASCSTRATRP